MQRILETSWFFCRLSSALIWNSIFLGIQLHFATRSFLSVFGLFVCGVVLFTYRLLTWQTGYFSNTHYSTSTEVQTALISAGVQFREYVCLATSCQARQDMLMKLRTQQPTHRDVLLNLLLLSSGQNDSTNSAVTVTSTLYHLDPNHPLVSQLK